MKTFITVLTIVLAARVFTGRTSAAEYPVSPTGAVDPVRTTKAGVKPDARTNYFGFGWKFIRGEAVNAQQDNVDESGWSDVQIPHDWSIEGPLDKNNPSGKNGGYFPGGTGWYRKHFKLSPEDNGKKIFVQFNGIHKNSDVWINGYHLGKRWSGYVSFQYDMTEHVKFGDENVLAVRVDNEVPTTRWYTGCGIYRDVRLVVKDKLYTEHWGTVITTPSVSKDSATAKIATTIKNEYDKLKDCMLITEVIDPSGKVIAETESKSMVPSAGEHKFTQILKIANPCLWSAESPVLYHVRTTLKSGEKVVEESLSSFGIRQIKWDSKQGLSVNGKKTLLKGVNIHHDLGCLGAAFYDRAMERRLEALKEIGCNAIRLSHNPHAPGLLDMCDRMGFYVIDEAFDLWNVEFYPTFEKDWERDLLSFVKRDRNHPSVILWSVGNELWHQGQPEYFETLKTLSDFVRLHEPTRAITCAMRPGNKLTPLTEKELKRTAEILDVLCVNYQEQWFEDYRKACPDMCIISSESFPFYHGTKDVFKAYHPVNPWLDVEQKDYVTGSFYWTGIDYLGEAVAGWPFHGWNCSLIDSCGFIRPVANLQKSFWTDEPMVHIAVMDESLDVPKPTKQHWDWPKMVSHWTLPNLIGKEVKIVTFTNCPTVELLLNDRSIGTKQLKDFPDKMITWLVPYQPGMVEARGIVKGKTVCKHNMQTAGKARRIAMIADRKTINADGRDLCNVEVNVIDENGILVPDARHQITFTVKGAGRIIGVNNGDITSTEPYKSETRKAFYGKALVVIQSAQTSGKITLTAKSEVLPETSIVIDARLISQNRATVIIDTAAGAKVYDRMIFGGFLEHFGRQVYGGVFEPGSPLSDEKGFRLDVIAAMKELKMPVVRWPGGCFVDAYHWQKGVGKEREPYGDFRWGVIESNEFGTHEFVEFCRRIGAEPYICHNGLADVQEMVDWVAYCNATEGKFAELRKQNGWTKPFNVKFWSVGNERSGKAYIHRVHDGAKAMKQLDPSILVTCSGTHGGGRVDPYLFESAGEYLDYISVHNYWLGRGDVLPRYDYMTAITKSEMPEAYIKVVSESLDKAGMGRIKIAFDEWNLRAWQHPGFPRDKVEDYSDPKIVELVERRVKGNDLAEQYTMADALFSASFLNACLRHCEDVTMANIAPIVNTRGPLFVHPEGIVKRTHFHTMAMYSNLLEERVADTKVTAGKLAHGENSVAVIDAIATVDESGKSWAIALVNRHPSDSVACTIAMKDILLDGEYDATVLTGESADSYNDIEHPNRVSPKKTKLTIKNGAADLPAHSLTIVDVPSQNAEKTASIDSNTVKQWSAPYRGWHYYPDHVIGPKPNIKGYEDVNKTDVPTVFQVPGDKKWYMTFIGFDGKGYQSFIAESDDLVKWTNMRLAMGYGPEGSFDYGGVVLGAYLYEDYDIKAPRTLKKEDGKYFSLYGAYPRQGGYELRPGYEGVATSIDGISWQRAKDEPILSVHQKDCGVWEKSCIYQPWLVEYKGKYYNFYNAAAGHIEQMGLALSDDILNWKRYEHNPVIPNGPEGSYNEKFSSDGKVFWDTDHWVNFFFGVGKGSAHIMAAYSRDLYHWAVDPEPLYKGGGNPSGLDKKYAHKISLVWNRSDDTYYMFYNAVGSEGRGIGLITSKPLKR